MPSQLKELIERIYAVLGLAMTADSKFALEAGVAIVSEKARVDNIIRMGDDPENTKAKHS
jgi:hypothetical protein